MNIEKESPEVETQAAQGGEEDFDALYDSIKGQGGPTDSDTPAVQTKEAAPAQPPPEPEYEYTWSGQKIKAPLSEVLKKASMGHDYAQKMSEFNRERGTWQERLAQAKALQDQFGEIDEWVRGNPDKWEKLQAVISAEKAGHGDLDPSHPLFQELQSLKKQLNEQILPTIQEAQQEKQRLQIEAEDKELVAEIQSIREQYKDLDWGPVDALGRTQKEIEVCKYAHENGFKSFRAAFRDLYHDDLVKFAEERGRLALKNESLKQSKTGLLGKSPAPTQGLQKATNIKNKSYDELKREALAEFGIQP